MNKSNGKNNSDYALVYSTHPEPKSKITSSDSKQPYSLKPSVRIEKKGRGGKSVTVVFKLPAHETLLKALAAHLKKSYGSGGTSYIKDQEGYVEIQGEHQKTILEAVAKFKWQPGLA